MTQDTLAYATPHNAEPVLAGTLVLMSLFRHTACPHAAQKVVHNLTLLSQRPELSKEFRDLCGRLCEEWRCEPLGAVASGPNRTADAAASSQNAMVAGKPSKTVR